MKDQPIAIVLAAGKGSRMKSELPKVLCEANGMPLVHYVLESLRTAGVTKKIVVVGYRHELVRDALQGDPSIEFVVQERQGGTGHAVMVCRDMLTGFQGPIVIVAGDSPMLQAKSIEKLLHEFASQRPACLLGTLMHEQPHGLGRIVRDDAGTFVGIVEEKDCTDQQREICEVNMSTYVIDCQKLLWALEQLTDENEQQEYYLTDVPGILIEAGEEVQALPVLDPIEALSVNTVEQLAIVEAAMNRQS